MGKAEIWIWWRNKGYSPIAVASIMGNIWAESVFKSNNVEDRCPLSDSEYTWRVDTGQYSREWFMYDGPSNAEGKHYGYGYYQHTFWSRKAGLWDLCKKRGKSISDESCQHEWAETELHQPEYLRVLNVLKSSASIEEMTKEFMCHFEKPADQSQGAINYRIGLAKQIYEEFAGDPKPKPVGESYWPPRMVDKSMSGPDVFALQGILCARGYYKGDMSGRIDDVVEAAIKAFQRDYNLASDGVAGPLTWSVLTDLGR